MNRSGTRSPNSIANRKAVAGSNHFPWKESRHRSVISIDRKRLRFSPADFRSALDADPLFFGIKIDLDRLGQVAYLPAHRWLSRVGIACGAADLRLTQIEDPGVATWRVRTWSVPLGHVSADREAGRRHGGWRNALSSVWLLADTARKDAQPLTDQSLPEIDES